jgi:trans-2,3-dihydro-3-hydroxyanthranilate isomerase
VSLPYLHYDVFTRAPLEGNQLAVFIDGRTLDAVRMQRIAREMSFSESTFVLPAERADTDVRMRIFTPFQEMPMAGHPTIGSAFALVEAGVIRTGTRQFVFGLNVGPTQVDLEWAGARLRFAWMTQGVPQFGPALASRAVVTSAIGLDVGDLADGLPIQEVSCGTPFLLVPLRDREVVDRAISDAAALGRLGREHGISRPLFVFALEGVEHDARGVDPGGRLPSDDHARATVYSRMFAPQFGITEDPATGSASGPLGCYLVQHRLVSPEAARRIVSLQGVAMGRPSRIHVSIEGEPDAIARVQVGGEAVLVGRGELVAW